MSNLDNPAGGDGNDGSGADPPVTDNVASTDQQEYSKLFNLAQDENVCAHVLSKAGVETGAESKFAKALSILGLSHASDLNVKLSADFSFQPDTSQIVDWSAAARGQFTYTDKEVEVNVQLVVFKLKYDVGVHVHLHLDLVTGCIESESAMLGALLGDNVAESKYSFSGLQLKITPTKNVFAELKVKIDHAVKLNKLGDSWSLESFDGRITVAVVDGKFELRLVDAKVIVPVGESKFMLNLLYKRRFPVLRVDAVPDLTAYGDPFDMLPPPNKQVTKALLDVKKPAQLLIEGEPESDSDSDWSSDESSEEAVNMLEVVDLDHFFELKIEANSTSDSDVGRGELDIAALLNKLPGAGGLSSKVPKLGGIASANVTVTLRSLYIQMVSGKLKALAIDGGASLQLRQVEENGDGGFAAAAGVSVSGHVKLMHLAEGELAGTHACVYGEAEVGSKTGKVQVWVKAGSVIRVLVGVDWPDPQSKAQKRREKEAKLLKKVKKRKEDEEAKKLKKKEDAKKA